MRRPLGCLNPRGNPVPAVAGRGAVGPANDAVDRAAVEASPGFEPVKLDKPLGKLTVDHLHRFYAQSLLGPRLLPSNLDARRLAAWIIRETTTQGGFSDTVDLVYREYKEGYAQFQKHEYQR